MYNSLFMSVSKFESKFEVQILNANQQKCSLLKFGVIFMHCALIWREKETFKLGSSLKVRTSLETIPSSGEL